MKKLLCIFFSLITIFAVSQSAQIDSFKLVLKKTNDDTTRIKILTEIGICEFLNGNFESSNVYSAEALDLAKKIGYRSGIIRLCNNMGSSYNNLGNYPEALKYHFEALKIKEQLGDQLSIAKSYNNIGNVYLNQGDKKAALKYQLMALKIRSEAKNAKGEIIDKMGLADSYNNVANVYESMHQSEQALKYYFDLLFLTKEINDQIGVAQAYNGIGEVYHEQGNYKEALKMQTEALKIFEEEGERYGECATLANIGSIQLKLKNYKEAEKFCLRSLALAKEEEGLDNLQYVNEILSDVYTKTGAFDKALAHYKAAIAIRDSLFNEENTKQTVKTQMKFEFDKKEAAAKLEQEKREAVAFAESKKQKIIIWSVCGILLLVISFAVFAYRSYLQKQKANVEITLQKNIIEEKQKEILDSIHYAKRIQTALLPSEKFLERNLNDLIGQKK